MASQIVPLTGLDQAGVVKDQPSVSLPPNVFTDVRNMRFRHGAVRKMEGDVTIFDHTSINFIDYWANPNIGPTDGYWIYVRGRDLYLRRATEGADSERMVYTFENDGEFQSTRFQGGFAYIINNGVDRPIYMLDVEGNTNSRTITAAILPGWDSYIVNERAVSSEFDSASSYFFDLGQRVDFTMQSLEVVRTRSGQETRFLDTDGAGSPTGTPGDTDYVPAELPDMPTQPVGSHFVSYLDTDTNTTVLHIGSGLAVDDTLTVNIQSRNEVNVRAGVVRSFGDLLIAGDLTEYVGTDTFRRLAGVVRTSDVAQAGAMPNNWNPFDQGASTADEFTLSDTGQIQDMVELQGRMMVYTNSSIHAISLTGQTAAPVAFSPITRQYGAMTTNAVQEFDGKHLIVGSQDIYVFGGHPGTIQSLAEGRVRDYFYENFAGTTSALDSFQIVRNQGKDELWLCYQRTNNRTPEALVYNYRGNTWTIRDLPSGAVNFSDAPVGGTDPNEVKPIAASRVRFYQLDRTGGQNLQATLERRVAPISPEFSTEAIMGMALWTQGTGDLTIQYVGSNAPATETAVYPTTNSSSFDIDSDYKADIRMQGRFMNFRIMDNAADDWNLSGIQLEVAQGGKR